MTTADLVVIGVGFVLLVGTLWAFLVPRGSGPRGGGRAQEIRVLVRGEFDPDIIAVEAGRPVRLLFYRDETDPRSERVVFERPPLTQSLTSFQTTAVEFTPEESGDYPFRCGSMKGLVAAQVGGEAARLNIGRGHRAHG